MCGRVALYTPPDRLARLLDAGLGADVAESFEPHWNVAPTMDLLGLTPPGKDDAGDKPTVLHPYRWGLVPPRAALSTGSKMFNARAETVAERPAFRSAFASKRVAVVVDGFYEWKKVGKLRQPYYFTRQDGGPVTFAGLWGWWKGALEPGGQEDWVRTCTIITAGDGPDMAGIHDRMPVVLNPDTRSIWVDPAAHQEELLPLLRPATEGTLGRYPVDRRVGNARNDDANLVLPTDEVGRLVS